MAPFVRCAARCGSAPILVLIQSSIALTLSKLSVPVRPGNGSFQAPCRAVLMNQRLRHPASQALCGRS